MIRLIKKAISDKNIFYQRFAENKDFRNNDSNLTIETTNQQYFENIAKNLSDHNISSKAYWSILKSFLTVKKVPCVPPIFHENRFITDFRKTTELHNSFFANDAR